MLLSSLDGPVCKKTNKFFFYFLQQNLLLPSLLMVKRGRWTLTGHYLKTESQTINMTTFAVLRHPVTILVPDLTNPNYFY